MTPRNSRVAQILATLLRAPRSPPANKTANSVFTFSTGIALLTQDLTPSVSMPSCQRLPLCPQILLSCFSMHPIKFVKILSLSCSCLHLGPLLHTGPWAPLTLPTPSLNTLSYFPYGKEIEKKTYKKLA